MESYKDIIRPKNHEHSSEVPIQRVWEFSSRTNPLVKHQIKEIENLVQRDSQIETLGTLSFGKKKNPIGYHIGTAQLVACLTRRHQCRVWSNLRTQDLCMHLMAQERTQTEDLRLSWERNEYESKFVPDITRKRLDGSLQRIYDTIAPMTRSITSLDKRIMETPENFKGQTIKMRAGAFAGPLFANLYVKLTGHSSNTYTFDVIGGLPGSRTITLNGQQLAEKIAYKFKAHRLYAQLTKNVFLVTDRENRPFLLKAAPHNAKKEHLITLEELKHDTHISRSEKREVTERIHQRNYMLEREVVISNGHQQLSLRKRSDNVFCYSLNQIGQQRVFETEQYIPIDHRALSLLYNKFKYDTRIGLLSEMLKKNITQRTRKNTVPKKKSYF